MVVRGSSGVLKNKYKGKTPVFISRDDHPEDVYTQKGDVGHKFNLRLYKSYTVWFNSELGPPPRDVQFRPRYGLEKNETIRIAVCLPKSTNTFSIYSKYPELHPKRQLFPVWVNNLNDLDKDTSMKAFYWDKTNGYLYFKMSSPYSFSRPGQQCAGDLCLEVNIKREDGGDEPAVCDTPVTPWYFKDRYPRVKNRRCRYPSTPEGLGAPIETGFSPPAVEDDTCDV
ncbi:transmembrane protein 2-like [Elysia marginata]|uniref:Transmembrane protein 2-like n=1 Tax=Elysia marginata TaxID=1093978 RepID=A0AAV4GR35_9GAST|nr:transmembrane protein 2-like [Elysia marginata]